MFGFYSITSPPHSMFCTRPAFVISSHMDMKNTQKKPKKTINVSFEEFKGKTLSLCGAEYLRQKDLEKLCEIYTSWYKLCVLHDHCDNIR